MKNKFWIFQVPIILCFSSCFLITDLGGKGALSNLFLREKVHPNLSRVANALTDLKFQLRGPQKPKNKIVVLEVDSAAIERLGRWPWHRDVVAFLIEKTFLYGAKVVGLDMVFSERDRRVPEKLAEILAEKKLTGIADQFETDSQLKGVIQSYSDRLVLGWTTELFCQPFYEEYKFCAVTDPEALKQYPAGYDKFSFSEFLTQGNFDPQHTPMISFVTPIANISDYNEVSQHAGVFNALLDSDGHIRRAHLFVIAKGKPYPSLALEMARVGLKENLQLKLNEDQKVEKIAFSTSGREIAVSPLGAMQVNFKGPSSVFPHISVDDLLSEKDVLEDPMNPGLIGVSKKEILKDAYVLIGVSAVGVFDMRQFPFEENSPGVYGHAHILDNLLSGDPLLSDSKWNHVLTTLFIMIFGVFFFALVVERLESVSGLLVFLGTIVSIGLFDFEILFRQNYNWNSVYLYLEVGFVFVVTLAAKYVLEEKNKKFIRTAFTKYVSPHVVDSILKDPSKLSLGGEKRELTILFSDIRGFTTFSEKMDAKGLASFLNDYLGIMTNLVFKNSGTLDKYIGDAVMAFWGAPLDQPDHAYNACKAASEMMAALDAHRDRFRTQYGIEVNIGIGINSGVVNVGNMGSENNFEYTVIGDHVNLASRLEGLTKKYGASIVTTRFTFDSIARSGKVPLIHRSLDSVKVKGKKNAVELIQIFEKEVSAEGLARFAEGRELYRACRWDDAAEKFKVSSLLLASGPDVLDGPSGVFLERCEYFKGNPPSDDWDGSWEMDSK